MQDISDDRDPFELVADSFLEHYRAGEKPSIDDYAARYPELAEQIRKLLPAMLVVERDLTIDPEPSFKASSSFFSSHRDNERRLGDYRILREIGRGGMGVVYEAEQISLGRRVALKVLPGHVAGDRTSLERFRHEAKAAARLHHTNIVPVFEVGREGDVAFYAMQFIQGQGLDQVIEELRRYALASHRTDGRGSAKNSVPATLGGQHDLDSLCAYKPELVRVAESLLSGRLGEEHDERPKDDSSQARRAALTELDGPDARPPDASPATVADLLIASQPLDTSGSAVLPGGAHVSELDTTGRRSPYFRSAAQIARQVAQALAHAHSRGVIHRDVKPSNLLLDTAGVVWITDFGLAKADDDGLTMTGDVLGTLRYMAPERFRGEGDARADIYALGLTLYELLTLRAAYISSDRLNLIELIKTEEPLRPRLIDSRVPRDLETIVLKAIEKSPDQRYQSADAFAEDLRRFLADEPIRARQISTSERYWRWARRNPTIATLGGVLCAVLLLATIVSLLAAARFATLAESESKSAIAERAARRDADRANTGLRTTQDELRQTVYATRSKLAMAAWDANDVGQFRDQLDLMPPREGELDLRGWEWHYLSRLANEAKLTFRGHYREVSQATFSPDGKTVASVQWGGRAAIWDIATGKVLREFKPQNPGSEGPNAPGVSSLAFSPDGRRLAGPGPNQNVGVWDTQTGALLVQFRASSLGTPSMTFSADGGKIISGSTSHNMRFFDSIAGKEQHVFESAHDGAVTRVILSPDGKRVASAGRGSIKLWDIEAAKLISTFPCPNVEVFGLAFSPDGKTLVSGGSDQIMRIWDVATGQERHRFWGHSSTITALAFRPDGRLVSGGADAVVRLWDIDAGRELRSFKGHTDRICSLSFSPDGVTLASSSFDFTVRLWDTSRPSQNLSLATQPLLNFSMAPGCVAFSPNGRLVVTGNHDTTARVWDITTGQLIRTFTEHKQAVTSVEFSPDGKLILSAGDDRTVRIWDAETGQVRLQIPQQKDLIYRAKLSSDGRRFLAATGDSILIWDIERKEQIQAIEAGGPTIFSADFSPDGRTIAAAITGAGVKIWNVETGRLVSASESHDSGRSREIVFSPDGRSLAVCYIIKKEIEIWSLSTGQLIRVLKGHSDMVRSLAFSRDGRRLVSSSQDQTIRVWDTSSGLELLALRGHFGWVRSVALSNDGLKIASASDDGRVLIWDASPDPSEHTSKETPAQ